MRIAVDTNVLVRYLTWDELRLPALLQTFALNVSRAWPFLRAPLRSVDDKPP